MNLISHYSKAALKVGLICVVLLIPNVISHIHPAKDDNILTDQLADFAELRKTAGESSPPVVNLNIDSQKNPDHPNMDPVKNADYPNTDFEKTPDYSSIDLEKNLDHPNLDSDKNMDQPFIQNVENFEEHLSDPFTQEITRVGSDEEDMIELSNLSRKKKFLWFQYGKDESGEARFRTLQGKNYNPYDFDENDKLHSNQYEEKLASKIGPKVEKVKTELELKPGASDLKIDANPPEQPDSDHEQDFQKPNSTVDQQRLDTLPINNDKPAKVANSSGEIPIKESTFDNNHDKQNSQMADSHTNQSTQPDFQTKMYYEEPEPSKTVKKERKGRKVEDSLMLEFAHNRPDSRILWLNYPGYRLTDSYRLIDEAAERTLITAREFGFVNTNTDSMKTIGNLITYVENNKIGYEVLNVRITPEWNEKPLKMRAAVCEYLVNDNMMLRKYEFVYDSSQPPEHIQAHNVTVLLQIEDIQPRRIGALSCPVIQPNTSLIATLFMSPVTYVNEDTDEYVFTFIEQDRINYPLYVRLMFLSRLASGNSVEDEFVEDQRINAIDELWWYGNLKETNPKSAPKGDEPSSKNNESAIKNEEGTRKVT